MPSGVIRNRLASSSGLLDHQTFRDLNATIDHDIVQLRIAPTFA